MKMTTMIAAALASSTLVAATPKEMLDNGDYYSFAKAVSYKAEIADLVTTSNAKAIYDVAMASNICAKANVVAALAYAKGDKTLLYSYLDTILSKTEYLDSKPTYGLDIWCLVYAKSTGSVLKSVNAKGKEVSERLSLTVLEPEKTLAFCKAAKAAGRFDTAAIAFWQVVTSLHSSNTGFDSHMTDEWKEFLNSFTAEDISRFEY